MTIVRVTGLDCAFTNCGIARALVDLTDDSVKVLSIQLVTTERGKEKQVRRNSDDLHRSQILNSAMRVEECVTDIFMAEIPTGAQSARAALAFGVAIGVLGGLRKPIIQVQPNDVKRMVTGRLSASKPEIIEWAMERYPDLPWKWHKYKGEMVVTADQEHLADAITIIHAGIKTDEFKQAAAIYRAMKLAV